MVFSDDHDLFSFLEDTFDGDLLTIFVAVREKMYVFTFADTSVTHTLYMFIQNMKI